MYQSVSTSGVQTYSVYAKAGTENGLFLRANGGSSPRCFFNLDSGTIGSEAGGLVDSKMEDVGNGWYRCSIIYNDTTNEARIYVADNLNHFPSSGNSYIQNAQLESGLVATGVWTSGASTAKAGGLIDFPRINYDANGENGALLLEPQRTNVITQSEYFGTWSLTYGGAGSAPVVTPNYGTSPEGVANAARVQFDAGGSTASDSSIMRQLLTLPATSHTISVYVKSLSGTANLAFTFNSVAVGTITAVDSEWKRFDYTGTGTGALSTYGVQLRGDATDQTADILMYAAQLEAGSYPTSYIPNHGTSGGVTRAADSCTGGGSAESINSVEGVLYAEISALVNGGENRIVTISDGSYDNSVRIQLYTNTNEIEMRIVTGNAVQALQRVAITNTLNFNKIAVKYKANDFQLWVNGSKLRFDTSGTLPSANTFDTLNFDDGDGNGNFYGNVKQVAVFNEALSDSELETLTTA